MLTNVSYKPKLCLFRAFLFLRSMALPFFFVSDLSKKQISLDEDTSKHMIHVLRMKKGEEILLTDGRGRKAKASITDDNRKKCMVEVRSIETEEEKKSKLAIGISLIKNSSRFEWFLEKATEIGVSEIIPLICHRTAREKFRHDRMQNILVSAMLQSQQCWLPHLHPPVELEKTMALSFEKKFIAHCIDGEKQHLGVDHHAGSGGSALVLIGPEGDFTHEEIEMALENNFAPVSLGNTRLRTETAGLVAVTLLALT